MTEIMRHPTMRWVYDRKKVGTAKKAAPIELCVCYRRRQKYLSTGVKVLRKNWHPGSCVVHRLDADELNRRLEILRRNVLKVINDMIEEGYISLAEIPSRLFMLRRDGQTFIQYMAERMEIRKYGKAEDTQERYDRFFRFFKDWHGIVYFHDITDSSILSLDRELTSRGMCNYSKWQNYHRFLNSFIIDAIEEGFMKRNPYKHLKIEKDKSKGGLGKYLSPKEFEQLRRFIPPTECLRRVKDLFVFQTYTCMSYIDLASFDATRLRSYHGHQVYSAMRGKTGQEFSFVLLPPAAEILERYHGVLPIISNVKYNQYLKVLAMMSNIHKPVSSHWARHTGATLLLNDGGMDMEVVAKVLGHSSTKITREVYAKLLDDTVFSAMLVASERIQEKAQ